MNTKAKCIALACLLAGLSGVGRAQTEKDDALSLGVNEIVRTGMREQKIPGVALAVMRNGKIVKAAGYGLANIELNVPVTPESLFHTESVGKTFTATAVMMLVEEGKVALDDKITKYLLGAPPAWDGVTIRHLLSHTSGIPDYIGNNGDPIYDLRHALTRH